MKNPKRETPVYPLVYGGGQERGFRSGTENTPMIAGLGKAAELVSNNLDMYAENMLRTKRYLEKSLKVSETKLVAWWLN